MGISGRRMVVALVGVALLAAACGSDDSEDSAATTTSDAAGSAQSTTTAAGTSGGASAAVAPASMEEWEALWAKERSAIVKKIKDNKWGLQADGKTVLGPEGFKMDLAKCPAGWSNTEGISDTDIEIGSHTPFSGTLADGGNINKGAAVLFDYYSSVAYFEDSTGKSRKITLVSKDDGYDPARSIPIVDEFLDSDKVAAIWGLGSPSVMKTYDKINQRCVAHLFAVTGHPAWGDPVNHPWTTGILFAYNTEAVLWGLSLIHI